MSEKNVPVWGGRKAQEYTAKTLETYGVTCHICGLPGATTADHLVPKSIDPSRTWDLSNLRPAHSGCNSSKGNRRNDDPSSIVENGMEFFSIP